MEKINRASLFSLQDKVIIVTGGASGIGRTVANYMAAMGAHIAIFDVSAEKAEGVAAELQELYSGRAAAFACDVTKPEQIEQALERVVETLGVPDVLVNNAGIGLHKFCLDFTQEEWLRVNDVNYNGIFYMATAFARLLIRHGKGGSIINTGSMSAQIVNVPQQQIAYNSSKAGVIHMTHTLAVELADYGIRVNAVSPGYIFTELTAKRPQELRDDWASRTPQKRLGVPDDLAAAYIYLASDSARYTTGSNIVVDGGYTLI